MLAEITGDSKMIKHIIIGNEIWVYRLYIEKKV